MVGRETLRGVWDSFRANRLRFLLTLTGVVIGSASLVLLSGLLEGGKEALIMTSQRAEEEDLIEVRARDAPPKQAQRTRRELDRADAETLGGSPLLDEARVVGQRQSRTMAFWRKNKKFVGLVGARVDALDLYRLHLARGRFFGNDDLNARRSVAVVGHKIWTDLFDSAESLDGLEVNTNGQRFAVIGVLAHKPSFGRAGPWEWDGRVLIPDTTFAAAIPPEQGPRMAVDRIFVRLAEVRFLAERIAEVRRVVKSTLLRRHYGVENFRVKGSDEDAKGELIVTIISLLVLGTAIISLAVGGINVMNIMLVSVTERTREIGIRRAVGAPRAHIMAQFLAESTLTAGLGGLFGVASGIGVTWIAARILDHITGGWAFHIVPWAPGLALGAALLVGIGFGLYPAWRAARLDPVEALRFE